MMYMDVYEVKRSIQSEGIWYAIWFYGFENLWTIFVATRMIKHDQYMLEERVAHFELTGE